MAARPGSTHETETAPTAPTAPGQMRRRGIFAAAAGAVAVIAGVATEATAQPVAAADVFSIPGSYSASQFQSSIWSISNNSFGSFAHGVGGFAFSSVRSAGVLGYNQSGTGVYGATENGSNPPNGKFGVYGQADSGTGTAGLATTGTGVSGAATSGTGVVGTSGTGIGVYGISGGGASPFGVVGAVTSAPGFALYGVASVSGTVGFAAGAGVSGAIAGQFSGPVNIFNNGAAIPGNLYIQGNYAASGTKSAAVPHPDGSHRLLYCMESPEAWFEDFGEGTITGGKAEVKLDPDFAAVVDTAKLHLFFTPHDDGHTLHLMGRSASGFTVVAATTAEATARGKKAGDVNGTFTYRVVAKRRDVKAARLATFTLPQEIRIAAPPAPPALPVPPPTPKK